MGCNGCVYRILCPSSSSREFVRCVSYYDDDDDDVSTIITKFSFVPHKILSLPKKNTATHTKHTRKTTAKKNTTIQNNQNKKGKVIVLLLYYTPIYLPTLTL